MISRVAEANFSAYTKQIIIDSLNKGAVEIPDVCAAVSALFDTRTLFRTAQDQTNIKQWTRTLLANLKFDWAGLNDAYPILALQCILKQKSVENEKLIPVYNKWVGAMRGNLPL